MPLPSLARLVVLASVLVNALIAEEAPKKIGIIGLDTSHVVAFTTVFNKGPKNPADAAKYAGFRVTHAFAQGSKDIPESTTRVPEARRRVTSASLRCSALATSATGSVALAGPEPDGSADADAPGAVTLWVAPDTRHPAFERAAQHRFGFTVWRPQVVFGDSLGSPSPTIRPSRDPPRRSRPRAPP